MHSRRNPILKDGRQARVKRRSGVAGFTLVELLISLSILAGMTVMSIRNFQLIQQDNSLHLGAMRFADALRKAQNLAQSGSNQLYPLASGYGVYVERALDEASFGSVRVFADLNTATSGKGRWDGVQENPPQVKDLQIGGAISPDVDGKKEIVVSAIRIANENKDTADVGFLSPDASAFIDGSAEHDTVVVVLKNKKNDKTKTVTFYRVTGRIDISQ